MAYKYRYAAIRGLEYTWVAGRDERNFNAQAANQLVYGIDPSWKPVTGDLLMSLTWRELETVAHVIRDAVTGE